MYPGRKHESLYVQSLRGDPLHEHRFAILVNYRCGLPWGLGLGGLIWFGWFRRGVARAARSSSHPTPTPNTNGYNTATAPTPWRSSPWT